MTSDRAIVTIRDSINRYETDLELPTNVPAGDLVEKIAAHLSVEVPELFQPSDTFAILAYGRRMADTETLSSLGLWSGSILDIQRG